MYKRILNKTKADAVIITDPLNMHYISGFKGGEGALYLSDKRRVLITDSRYTEQAGKESDFEIIEENAGHKRMQILSECIAQDAAGIIAFEDACMTYAQFIRYKDELSSVNEWVGAGKSVDELRIIKSPDETAMMAKAAEIADTAFERVLKAIRPGMTELEGAAELEYQMKKLGAADVSFSTIFAAGGNSSMPHAVPTDYRVKNGDFITMDFGCRIGGYCSDMTRTVAVGEVSAEQKKVYDTVLKAQLAALDIIGPGLSCRDVDKAARDVISAAGYGKYFGHALGHSVGLAIHEEPRLSPLDDTVLAPGMTETVEPGIYIPGKFGVRIEDMVIITENGYKNFVRSPKELIVL